MSEQLEYKPADLFVIEHVRLAAPDSCQPKAASLTAARSGPGNNSRWRVVRQV